MTAAADRVADATLTYEPVLTGEEAEQLAQPGPSDDALAAIAAAEERELRRARMQAWRL